MNASTATTMDARPWYRYAWPWLLMVPPALAVVAGIALLWLAGAIPAMVVEDYGRIDEIGEQRLAQDAAAASAELTAVVRLGTTPAGDDYPVSVRLASGTGTPLPGVIVLELRHPTLAGHDRRVALAGADGNYQGRLEGVPGRYYLEISDADARWRLTGELPDGINQLVLRPRTPGIDRQ